LGLSELTLLMVVSLIFKHLYEVFKNLAPLTFLCQ